MSVEESGKCSFYCRPLFDSAWIISRGTILLSYINEKKESILSGKLTTWGYQRMSYISSFYELIY